MEGNPHFFQTTHIPSFFDHCCEIGTIKSAGVNVFWRNGGVLSSSLVWSSWVLNCLLPWVNCELAMRRRFNHTRCFRACGLLAVPLLQLSSQVTPMPENIPSLSPITTQPESKRSFSKKGRIFLLITLSTGSRTRKLGEHMKSTRETIYFV